MGIRVYFVLFFLAFLISPEGVLGQTKCCRSDRGYNPWHVILKEMQGWCKDGSRATPCCSRLECDLACCNCQEVCRGGQYDEEPWWPVTTPKPSTTTTYKSFLKNCPELESRNHFHVNVTCKLPTRGWTYVGCSTKEVPHGTEAHVKCQNFYLPVARKMRGEIKMTCSDGVWSKERSFRELHCELDCQRRASYSLPAIIKGKVPTHDMSWHAAIFQKNIDNGKFEYICGGSLIDKSAVLTAAHCLKFGGEEFKPSDLRVILGAKTKNYSTQGGAKIYKVNITYIHHSYDELRYSDDIGLIVLDQEIAFQENIRPICLPAHDEAQQLKYGDVIGYDTESDGVLKKGRVQLLGHEDCKNRSVSRSSDVDFPKIKSDEHTSTDEEGQDVFPGDEIEIAGDGHNLKTNELCGFSKNGPGYSGVILCRGDSGGGLIGRRGNSNHYFLHGVLSRFPRVIQRNVGQLCDDGVTIFSKVYDYLDWIEDILELDEIGRPNVVKPTEVEEPFNSED